MFTGFYWLKSNKIPRCKNKVFYFCLQYLSTDYVSLLLIIGHVENKLTSNRSAVPLACIISSRFISSSSTSLFFPPLPPPAPPLVAELDAEWSLLSVQKPESWEFNTEVIMTIIVLAHNTLTQGRTMGAYWKIETVGCSGNPNPTNSANGRDYKKKFQFRLKIKSRFKR